MASLSVGFTLQVQIQIGCNGGFIKIENERSKHDG